MKALIFAAGLGTRLKPLTDTMPKALVKVGEKPLLAYVIERLKGAGVTEIIINIHHFGEQIIEYIKNNNSFGIKIDFSDETNLLLDTGGGIKKASSYFNDGKPFFIHNVDIISNVDLKKLYQTHLELKASATLFVSDRKTNRYLLFDENNILKGWCNKQTGEVRSENTGINPNDYQQLAFNGIHVISPEIFPLMNNFPEKFPIIDFYLSVSQKIQIQAFTQKDVEVIDVGKIDILSNLILNT